MHKLQTVPQKEPDFPPEESALLDDSAANMTPAVNTKKLRMVPSSASSQAQTGQVSPSKGIYLEQPAAETRGELTQGNNSILEESIGKDGLKLKN